MPERSFAVVSLERAHALVRGGGLQVVRASHPGSSGGAPSTPERGATSGSSPRGVLVIAATKQEGFRAAAALARSGNHPTYLCISANADERGSLYALALKTREILRDENH